MNRIVGNGLSMTGRSDPCNLIIPQLYLGSWQAARSQTHLATLGITNVVNCTKHRVAHPDVKYVNLSLNDNDDEQNIVDHFEETFKFIDDAHQRGETVLIHCIRGVSRSATITVGFIMWKHDISLDEALTLVKIGRRVADPRQGFISQLRAYEETLKQKKKDKIAPNTNNSSTTTDQNQ